MTFKKFFHYASYLQYPLLAISLFFAIKPYLLGFDPIQNPGLVYENLNLMLIFLGLGISFSSLQDPAKSKNKLNLYVYSNPLRGKAFIILIIIIILYFLGLGLYGYFYKEKQLAKDLSVGLIILSMGMFGFLKASVEMFENHRTDKNSAADKS